MSDQPSLSTVYDPQAVEETIYHRWMQSKAFASLPSGTPHDKTFTVVIPPPNVTGALHLGHALNGTLQDILVRYHRMRGFNTLWQPGTDHAGIATQAVVERRIREQEGKNRHDLGREELVRRIWQWKDEYEVRILSQLKLMGCSCDWDRVRFTLDEGLATAVRHQFFKMFKEGLIFRGKRLVNWDTELQTAVANDEVYYETVKGHFWHFRYPVIDPKPGEPEHVVIATTRPETMLGDTAVAVNPNPAARFDKAERELRATLEKASDKDKAAIESQLEDLNQRRETHLELLETLCDMAKDGRKIRLPLVDREIPLIADDWANPTLGSGCVKITPAHDPNDYEVALRHDLPKINVMTLAGMIAPIVESNGSANPHSSKYEGLAFTTEGRKKIVADLDELGLLGEVEDRQIELSHSDRSKAAIEPFLSDQWFVYTDNVSKVGTSLGDGEKSLGLAQAAIDVVQNGQIQIFPQRYAKSYLDWLGEKRDWCISRQLWWGHRIPVWRVTFASTTANVSGTEQIKDWQDEQLQELQKGLDELGKQFNCRGDFFVKAQADTSKSECFVCSKSDESDKALAFLTSHVPGAVHYALGQQPKLGQSPSGETANAILKLKKVIRHITHDEDVLDTWFSSALWPFSTLGWPEETDHMKQYYPGSVLITSRDIITNWVARMVMFGRYAIGKIPFDHVYIHPKILDGRGETMSKSKGNGVDPVDVVHTHGADALRYAMADMCTETQDIRMPVEYICPHCSKLVDQAIALKTEEQARKSRGQKLERKLQPADCTRVKCTNKECSQDFATKWADTSLKSELKVARETSDKFDIGRNFCNKLWNAARFALMNLEGATCEPIALADLMPEDRWILGRLSQTIRRYHQLIQGYQFSASVKELREFFRDSLCDWYIELTKPRMSGSAGERSQALAKQVLAVCIDQSLRLFHPTIPFITEELWSHLNSVAPSRGLPGLMDLDIKELLTCSAFPPEEGYAALEDDAVLATFTAFQDTTRGVRELRTQCKVSPKERVNVTVAVPQAQLDNFEANAHIVKHMAGIGELTIDPSAKRPKNAGSVSIQGLHIYVHDISDDVAEKARGTKTLASLVKEIAGKEAKLSNEKFIANAKPEVVELERARLTELIAQRDSLERHIAELNA